jgi:glycosyltransferase involved in cell wall biosynthesis
MIERGGVGVNASIIGESPTGLGLYAINLVCALDSVRSDLSVYTSSPQALGGIRARVLPVPARVRPERGLRGHLARLTWVQTALRRRVRAGGLGVLLNTVPEAILSPSIAQVTVVHDVLPLIHPAEYPRQRYYFRCLLPRVLRHSRLVVADSQATQRDLVERCGVPPAKVRIIYPGYDPAAYYPNGTEAKPGVAPYLLYVGNLLPHKNVLRLLDALALLRAPGPARLIIRGAGRASYTRALRQRVEALRLDRLVTFHEYADQRTLRDLYAHAECLVLPSLGEGFGLPVLEAMACGTPVITSNVSSLPEAGGDAALRVDPRDPAGLAEAMDRVLADRDLRADLRDRGLKWAAAFSWDRTASEMSRVLDEARAPRQPG